MKQIIALLIVLVSVGTLSAQDDAVKWMNLDEALAAQKKSPKPIMMDMYTPWCGPCKMMLSKTFTDKKVIKYLNENYYAVKMNAEGDSKVTWQGKTYENPEYDKNRAPTARNSMHQLTRALRVPGYPTLVFMDTEGALIKSEPGYRTPSQLMPVLEEIMAD